MSMKSSLLQAEEAPDRDLTSINLGDTDERSRLSPDKFSEEESSVFGDLQAVTVKTLKGNLHVAIQGDRRAKHTAIVTLHDIGQNHSTCFQSFFCFHQFKPLLQNFTVYHINFPGQEEDAEELPQDYIYPTMEEMANAVEEVFQYFGVTNSICFGVGAGANVFARLGLKDPKHIECMILVNGTVTTASWSDWGYEKMSSHYLKTKGMTAFCQDYLLYHYFGKIDDKTNQDLVGIVKDNLQRIKHPRNLAFFIESYSKRNAIKIQRPVVGQTNTTLKCGVLLLTGDHSPAVDDTVTFNSKLDPSNSSWMKISDASGMVLEEQPTVATNAIILFLQGYGFVMKVRPPTLPCNSQDEIEAPPIC